MSSCWSRWTQPKPESLSWQRSNETNRLAPSNTENRRQPAPQTNPMKQETHTTRADKPATQKLPSPKQKTARCRHARSWIMAGGNIEWCWQCGAIRKLSMAFDPEGSMLVPVSVWQSPIKDSSENPFEKWQDESRKFCFRKFGKHSILNQA